MKRLMKKFAVVMLAAALSIFAAGVTAYSVGGIGPQELVAIEGGVKVEIKNTKGVVTETRWSGPYPKDKVDASARIVTFYTDIVKWIAQLGLAGLLLPPFFVQSYLGKGRDSRLKDHLNNWFLASWCMLLACIGSALLYLWIVVHGHEDYFRKVAGWGALDTRVPFAAQVAFAFPPAFLVLGVVFFLGGVFFAKPPEDDVPASPDLDVVD